MEAFMPSQIKKKPGLTFFENKKPELINFSKPILISCESITPFTEQNVVSDDGRLLYIDLIYFNCLSRNNNEYPEIDTKRSFEESTWINENLRNRTLYGELEHPPASAELSRFMCIEPQRYAWNIMSIEDKGDHYSGQVGLCAPLGTSIALPNMRDYGCNYGASCRISTPNYVVKDQGGKKVYIKKYKMYPITFDMVTCCGIPQCRLIKDGQYTAEKIDMKYGLSNKQSAGITGKESTDVFMSEFSAPADTIKEMLKSSESGRIVSDIFGLDYSKSSIILTKDKKVKISTEDGVSATIPFNSYILSDILKQ